jgi:hypothetical protein
MTMTKQTVRYRVDTAEWKRLRARIIRDAVTCGLCGRALYPELTYPHDSATVVDHIRPLRVGGDQFDETNCRAVHSLCNRRRKWSDTAGPTPLPVRPTLPPTTMARPTAQQQCPCFGRCDRHCPPEGCRPVGTRCHSRGW